jgi:hypothetical protein
VFLFKPVCHKPISDINPFDCETCWRKEGAALQLAQIAVTAELS